MAAQKGPKVRSCLSRLLRGTYPPCIPCLGASAEDAAEEQSKRSGSANGSGLSAELLAVSHGGNPPSLPVAAASQVPSSGARAADAGEPRLVRQSVGLVPFHDPSAASASQADGRGNGGGGLGGLHRSGATAFLGGMHGTMPISHLASAGAAQRNPLFPGDLRRSVSALSGGSAGVLRGGDTGLAMPAAMSGAGLPARSGAPSPSSLAAAAPQQSPLSRGSSSSSTTTAVHGLLSRGRGTAATLYYNSADNLGVIVTLPPGIAAALGGGNRASAQVPYGALADAGGGAGGSQPLVQIASGTFITREEDEAATALAEMSPRASPLRGGGVSQADAFAFAAAAAAAPGATQTFNLQRQESCFPSAPPALAQRAESTVSVAPFNAFADALPLPGLPIPPPAQRIKSDGSLDGTAQFSATIGGGAMVSPPSDFEGCLSASPVAIGTSEGAGGATSWPTGKPSAERPAAGNARRAEAANADA